MASTKKVFSLEGKGLKLDTAEDLESHIAELKAMDDVEEVRILGNTLGVGACKLLGEVLSAKKSLQVCLYPRPSSTRHEATSNMKPGRQPRRHLHRPSPERNPRGVVFFAHLHSQPAEPPHDQPQ